MNWKPSNVVNSFRRWPRNVVAPLGKKQYLEAVHGSGEGCFQCFLGLFGCEILGPDLLEWALLHADGIGCSRGKLPVFDDSHPDQDASFYMAGQMILEMLQRQASSELLLSGPLRLCNELKKAFLPDGKYGEELDAIPNSCQNQSSCCLEPLKVEIVSLFDLPPVQTTQLSDVQLNAGETHDGPSEQLCTALASVATSAKTSPALSAADLEGIGKPQSWGEIIHGKVYVAGVDPGSFDSTSSGSVKCLRPLDAPYLDLDTPMSPLPPPMLSADALCVRSGEAGCCVAGGVHKLAIQQPVRVTV